MKYILFCRNRHMQELQVLSMSSNACCATCGEKLHGPVHFRQACAFFGKNPMDYDRSSDGFHQQDSHPSEPRDLNKIPNIPKEPGSCFDSNLYDCDWFDAKQAYLQYLFDRSTVFGRRLVLHAQLKFIEEYKS